MKKFSKPESIYNYRKKLLKDKRMANSVVIISAGTCGQASGANELIRASKKYIIEKGLVDRINLRITGCHGFCEMEPSILVKPGGIFYPKLKAEDVPEIIEATMKGEVVKKLLFKDPSTGETEEKENDIPFFKYQTRTLLSKNEDIDPIHISDYILSGGYSALAKALSMEPSVILKEVKMSGLRGRGGAGFPTGFKWEILSKSDATKGKYLVCNADEGDPGAYMDRCLLEGNPHSIIEGMIVGSLATGADKGIIYVRNEYPLAIKHLIIALSQSRARGILGENVLGTGHSFDIKIVRGAGAFVCGEETALVRSIEGTMGEPKQRPPFPVQRGIYGRPTAINNVETWANIPQIIDMGHEKFSNIGTKNNSGTKIFSLVGKIKNTGLVEVPMGMSISGVVNRIGGGASGEGKIKAIQTGGPSGGCIPASLFDTQIDYDHLAEVGSIMGSGGMIVMDESTCMVDVAKYFMKFLKDESCGKCFTCRKGTQRMYEILEDISEGRATLAHLDLLRELAITVKDTSMCGLGQSAANPVLSTLEYFREEYEKHIVEKRCDAFVCSKLIGPSCQAACPLGTEAWRYIALIEKGMYEDAYRVIRESNPLPSVCARVCDHQCEQRCKLAASGSSPVAIRALKRFVTDKVDPGVFKPVYTKKFKGEAPRIAVVGAGPAGLSAAHYLSLRGYKITLFESHNEPGGMLISGVPEYRLPRKVLNKEIKTLIDENVEFKPKTVFGQDITLDSLLEEGYLSVFLALGSHMSRSLNIPNEDTKGVFKSMDFLKAFNHDQQEKASGNVGVIGGGNSAIDAARVALRQKNVKSVSIFYRRSRNEMPAFPEEIEEALKEGIKLETLVSPVKINKTAKGIKNVEFIRNRLGELDDSGRASFKPVKGSEFTVKMDTLIVAIGEQLYPFSEKGSSGMKMHKTGMLVVDQDTLMTQRKAVFAGGDAVTGPNSVVAAIAAGKRAAIMIDRMFSKEELKKPILPSLPHNYLDPADISEEEMESLAKQEPEHISPVERSKNFKEVEKVFSEHIAKMEARRCLRCDLEFTASKEEKTDSVRKEASGSD